MRIYTIALFLFIFQLSVAIVGNLQVFENPEGFGDRPVTNPIIYGGEKEGTQSWEQEINKTIETFNYTGGEITAVSVINIGLDTVKGLFQFAVMLARAPLTFKENLLAMKVPNFIVDPCYYVILFVYIAAIAQFISGRQFKGME